MRVINVPKQLWSHSINLDTFYDRFTDELCEVPKEDLIPGDIYINIDGHSLMFLGDNEFQFVTRSPFYMGKNTVIDLKDKKVNRMFWTLIRNDEKNHK